MTWLYYNYSHVIYIPINVKESLSLSLSVRVCVSVCVRVCVHA